MINRSVIITVITISVISAIFLIPSQNAEATNLLSSVPNTLVAFWPADGNAKDVTGHGHNGVLSGNVVFGNGVTGGAFRFNGVNGSVNVGSLGINNTNAPFSIVAWIKPSATILNDKKGYDIVAEGSSANGYGNGQYFSSVLIDSYYAPGGVVFQIGSGQTFATIKYVSVPFGSGWTFVAVTYDGTKTPQGMKIYINGTLQNAHTTPASTLTGSPSPRDDWTIGAENPGPNIYNPFNGSIDDVRVFSCPLSNSDVQALFHGVNVAKCNVSGALSKSKLVDYYVFNNTNGNPVKDYCTSTGSKDCLPENDMSTIPANSLCQLTGLIDNSCGFFSDGQLGEFTKPLTWFSDGTTSYSINTWINLNGSQGSGADRMLLSTAQETHVDGINIYAYQAGHNNLEWTIHNSAGNYIMDIPTPDNSISNLNQWYMLTFTLDNTVSPNIAKIYINGHLASQGRTTGTLDAVETPTWGSCCTSTGSTQPLGGKTDETSFWQRVLAPSEIVKLYNGGHALSLLR